MKKRNIFATQIGLVQVESDENGLISLDFLKTKTTRKHKALNFSIPFSLGNLGGTKFQQRVWKALLKIPRGETRTYGEIAKAIGSPGAARAVGSACGANPLPLYIPCHRVVASGGKLGGFSGGLEIKKKLLVLEGAYGT